MKKKILNLLCMALVPVLLVGCGTTNKSSKLSVNDFKTIMKNEGVTAIDNKSDVTNSSCKNAYIANGNNYVINFYEMNDKKAADDMADTCIQDVDDNYTGGGEYSAEDSSKDGVVKNVIKTGEAYCEIVKNENTVIYVVSYDTKGKNIKNVMEKLEKK